MLGKKNQLMVPLTYKYAADGLPPTIQFTNEIFIPPPTTKSVGRAFYMQTMEPELETTEMTTQNKRIFGGSDQPTI